MGPGVGEPQSLLSYGGGAVGRSGLSSQSINYLKYKKLTTDILNTNNKKQQKQTRYLYDKLKVKVETWSSWSTHDSSSRPVSRGDV